jgi:PAS domain-containing protein
VSTTRQSASSRPSTGALLEQAVLHAPDPLLLAEQGTVRFVSPSIAGCLGWSAADLTGRPLAEASAIRTIATSCASPISQQERRTQQGT